MYGGIQATILRGTSCAFMPCNLRVQPCSPLDAAVAPTRLLEPAHDVDRYSGLGGTAAKQRPMHANEKDYALSPGACLQKCRPASRLITAVAPGA